MNIQEIINNGNFLEDEDGFKSFKSTFQLVQYQKDIELEIQNIADFSDVGKIEKTLKSTFSFLNNSVEELYKESWDHYQTIISDCAYGFVSYDSFKDAKSANEAYFGYQDESEAFDAMTLSSIWFDMEYNNSINCNLIFDCPWEDEHNFNVLLENGKISEVY